MRLRKGSRQRQAFLVCMSCLGMLTGQTVGMAGEPAIMPKSKSVTKVAFNDIALDAKGTFAGRVIDEQGNPLQGAVVTVRQGQKEIGSVVTDEMGQFQVTNLRPGLYQVSAGNSTEAYRAWADQTAPPSARQQALMVSGNQVVRGQNVLGFGPGLSFNEALLLGVGVTGITLGTIGIVKANDNKDQLDQLTASP